VRRLDTARRARSTSYRAAAEPHSANLVLRRLLHTDNVPAAMTVYRVTSNAVKTIHSHTTLFNSCSIWDHLYQFTCMKSPVSQFTCISPVLRCLRSRRPSTIVLRKLDFLVFSTDAARRPAASLSPTTAGNKFRPVSVGGIAAPVSTKPPRLSSTLRSRSLTTWSSSSSLRSDVSDSRIADDFCRTWDAKPYGTLWRTP